MRKKIFLLVEHNVFYNSGGGGRPQLLFCIFSRVKMSDSVTNLRLPKFEMATSSLIKKIKGSRNSQISFFLTNLTK